MREIFNGAGWLALLGLLLQVFLPLLHHPETYVAGGQIIHICSWAAKTGQGDNPAKTPIKKTPSCPLCQSLHHFHGNAITGDIATAFVLHEPLTVKLAAFHPQCVALPIMHAARSRAPPAAFA